MSTSLPDKFLKNVCRRETGTVMIGDIPVGGNNPVVIQTMSNRLTTDTGAIIEQSRRVRDAGCRIIRFTAPGRKEGEHLKEIRRNLDTADLKEMAIVADIHFTADVALIAAEYAEKVRINPGNFGLPEGEKFTALIEKCRSRGVALRIGVNHGSLSEAVMDKYGDTPEGMVESAMMFLRVCRDKSFDQVVVSMKSSNARVMVRAYRLLVRAMDAEGMYFPLHLGVTEAGNGPEGRIKSAVGIATLLCEGLGDTVRVSLTEDPANEIPVAREIIDRCMIGYICTDNNPVNGTRDYPDFSRRITVKTGNIGAGNIPVLWNELDTDAQRAAEEKRIAVLQSVTETPVAEWRNMIKELENLGDRRPVILYKRYNEPDREKFLIRAACDFGPLFLDGLADGLRIENDTDPERDFIDDISLMILQASRTRTSRTEFIACPGCGRTLFDLEKTLADVREVTSHLKHLKIGVMGCIVNGPGEMADADYGYVGSGPGKITLYKNKEAIKKGIPQEFAIEELLQLIRNNGDWIDPVTKR